MFGLNEPTGLSTGQKTEDGWWRVAIAPALHAVNARRVAVIGASTIIDELIDYCRGAGGRLDLIGTDRHPVCGNRDREGVRLHPDPGLNVLWRLDDLDAVILDGDPNWYSVFHTLTLIGKTAAGAGRAFPLVFLSGIGWPYGRRDGYVEPELIPEGFRQPWQRLGLMPGAPELAPEVGLYADRCHASVEGGVLNGVLTAVEDFLAQSAQSSLAMLTWPGWGGMGLLYPVHREQERDFGRLIAELRLSLTQRHWIETLDAAHWQAVWQTLRLRQEVDERESLLAAAHAQIANGEAQRASLTEQLRAAEQRLNDLAVQAHQGEMARAALAGQLAEAERFRNALAAQARQGEMDRAALANQLTEAEKAWDAFAAQARQNEQERVRWEAGQVARATSTAPLHQTETTLIDPPDDRIVRLTQMLAQAEQQLQRQARDLARLQDWMNAAELDLRATLASWRWRIGDRLVRAVEVLLWRRRGPLAVDHLQSIFTQARQWQQGRRDLTLVSLPRAAETLNGPERAPQRDLTYPLPADLPDAIRQSGVSIIILNRNGAALLEALCASLKQHLTSVPHEILIVDHASTDHSARVLETWARILPLRIFALKENRSYAESNNFAAREARYPTLLLLNNDIVLTSAEIIETGLRALQDPLIGVVGFKLLYPDDHAQFPGEIQHAGIRFHEDRQFAFYRPHNLRGEIERGGEAWRMSAVTAAALLCRRDEFLALGGFHEAYQYGYEDVDLCLTYRRQGRECILLGRVSAIHNESATQQRDRSQAVRKRRLGNIATFRQRFGYALKRRIRIDRFDPDPAWNDAPPTVGFIVTEAHAETAAGDYFTALELAGALASECGWECRFLALRDRAQDCYDLSGIDILIVMVDQYDLRTTHDRKPGLIRIAWMRNWFERWADRPWFDDYDLFLCSSRKAADYIREVNGKDAQVLRIACNPARFSPLDSGETAADAITLADARKEIDYCFTGSHWNAEREIEALDPRQLPWTFALYGQGWDKHPQFKPYWKGFLPYHELPAVYRQTRLLVDDANHVTKPWASVNSRVFDALASGVLTITNGVAGAEEVFGGLLPTYRDRAELEQQLRTYLDHPEQRIALTRQLREQVLAHHTYANRARELRDLLANWSRERLRFAIKVPAPAWDTVQEWGDYHFARALQRALVRAGYGVRIDILPEWYRDEGFGDDVVLVLRGLSVYEPRPDHINLMWNISHPDKVTDAEYEGYDHVFVASQRWAGQLSARLRVPVTALLQCTDPTIFYPDPDETVPAHEVLFVGNSRRQFRPIVRDALKAGLPLSVYGTRWEKLIPGAALRGEHVPNERLRTYYSRCQVLLNDHWPGMREQGFLSNRLFDAAACGAAVLSDTVEGLGDVFGEAVATYDDTPAGLKARVGELLADPGRLAARREEARARILAGHTFDHRAQTILEVTRALDAERAIPW
ncbi:GT2 family glycosyltransferase [Thiobaca trueperi]|uniref:GT2 family glycosyltransferase n=2 Tax=Thiobaca trueperi TaxID=127458 RepID=A0A4R3N7J9_9GAMM|nr:GT2 family glycosyltransferase [Thiobaca trueperi]